MTSSGIKKEKPTISVDELDRLADEFAARCMDAIPPQERSYDFFKTDEEAHESHKKNFITSMMKNYKVTPPTPTA